MSNGHIVAWKENEVDKWEFSDDPEMIVYLYDKAFQICDLHNVFLFKAEVLTLKEMRDTISHFRTISKE